MASIGLDYWLCADRSALAESALPPHAKFLFFFLRVPKKARDSLVLDKRPLSVHPLFTVPTIQLIFFFQFCVVTLERHCVYIFCMHRRRHNKECGCVMCQRRRVHPKPMTKKGNLSSPAWPSPLFLGDLLFLFFYYADNNLHPALMLLRDSGLFTLHARVEELSHYKSACARDLGPCVCPRDNIRLWRGTWWSDFAIVLSLTPNCSLRKRSQAHAQKKTSSVLCQHLDREKEKKRGIGKRQDKVQRSRGECCDLAVY